VLTKADEKLLVALRRRVERERRGLFLAEGVRLLEAAIAAGLDIELAVASQAFGSTDREAAALAAIAERAVPQIVPAHVLARVAATDAPQGIVAALRTPEASLATLALADRATVLVLDAVQDPGNFGSLVRTADALGAAAVIALEGTVDPWNPKAVRAAAGSSFHLPVVGADGAAALDWLRAERFTVLAADVRGEPLERAPSARRIALVVGNEGAGIRPAVADAADARIAVPILGSAESLNVGVAAGILLYLLTRER